MMNDTIKVLSGLFQEWTGTEPSHTVPLPASGSPRRYYRLATGNTTAIGAYNPIPSENTAFIILSRHFRSLGFRVPAVLAVHPEGKHYLTEDLGNTTLSEIISRERDENGINDRIIDLYRHVLRDLSEFQLQGLKGIDPSVFYPRSTFDARAVRWDLNYFKYAFMRPRGFDFDEDRLEDDFDEIAAATKDTVCDYFMYRDFQTRNMMMMDNAIYYIDYQGGRRGPLAYDPASLLFSSRANLPDEVRKALFGYYVETLASSDEIAAAKVQRDFPVYALIRIIQMLGAYGYRGYFEGKQHFLESVPYALQNLDGILNDVTLRLPEIRRISKLASADATPDVPSMPLVSIKSFSYKKGLPADESGHGGGFIFDCRALPNPGREEAYKELTGRDKPVVQYLESFPEVTDFLEAAFKIVAASVRNYNQRRFANLSVGFGCTGGQHRSVYCAARMASMIRQRIGARVELRHCEIKTNDRDTL
jgi:aminoglycoside/choline kinase family phosphotransferase